jgi:small basic protein
MKTKLIIYSFSLAAILTDLLNLMIDNVYQFIAILVVVGLDASLAMARAYKTGVFETNKALIAVVKFTIFCLLLAVVLVIEKGFPVASFLSESILLPILLVQLISILKNMQLLGLINNTTLDKILTKIDKHKEVN